MADGITINTAQFRAAMREYKEFTKRDLATILNTKGFYISRGAVRATYRPTKEKVRRDLEKLFGGKRVSKVTVTRFSSSGFTQFQAPLLALIINARRGRKGLPGLYGSAMKKVMDSEVGRRYRSIGFIASGFLQAIKDFEPYAERKGSAPARDSSVKQFGQAKGYGTPARSGGWVVKAIINNSASAHGDTKGALEKFATAGLQTAVDAEVASMKQYIEQKMQETANKVNAKKR